MITANRQELLKQKKRLKSIKKGHKLLKDKRDSLMRYFMALIKETLELRQIVDAKYLELLNYFNLAKVQMDERYVDLLAETSEVQVGVYETIKNVMGVKIPQFTMMEQLDEITGYSIHETNIYFDKAIKELNHLLEKILLLLEKENALRKLAKEIISTRRRVNALEDVIIPVVEKDIKYIKQKLEETAIEEKAKLMKMKDNL